MLLLKDEWEFAAFGTYNVQKPGKLEHLIRFIRERHRDFEGDVIESGVFKGSSLIAIAMVLKECGSDKKVYGFDSFAGFPPVYDEKDEISEFDRLAGDGLIAPEHLAAVHRNMEWRKCLSARAASGAGDVSTSLDFSSLSLELLQNKLRVLGLDNVILVDGNFSETMTAGRPEPAKIFAGIVDCDLYKSHLQTFEFIWPRLVPGGMLYLDEYYSLKFPGARRATDEFIRGKDARLEMSPRVPGDFERWHLTRTGAGSVNGRSKRIKGDDVKGSINFRGEDLEPYGADLVEVKSCIVCGSETSSEWESSSAPFQAAKCDACGFVWMRKQANPEALNRYYADYIGRRRTSNTEKMNQRAIQYEDDREVLQRFVQGGRVLDVGCNGGFFLACLSDGFEKHGIEIDPAAVEYARDNYDFGKNVRCGDILEADYPDGSFDAVVMRGTIEHVAKPVAVIERCARLLKPGGIYFITATPNVDALPADLFRDRWKLFHPVQHLWHFSPRSLDAVCGRFGMSFVSVTFPYLGTPYENVREDLLVMAEEITAQEQGVQREELSPPFFESMMSVVFRKA